MGRDEFVDAFRKTCYQIADALEKAKDRLPYSKYMSEASAIVKSNFPYLPQKSNGKPGISRSQMESIVHWVLRDSGMDVRSVRNGNGIDESMIDMNGFDKNLIAPSTARQEKYVADLLVYLD